MTYPAPRPPTLPSCACSLGAIPIVNENDTVAVQELRIGDNDTLSAQVGCLFVGGHGVVPAHGQGVGVPLARCFMVGVEAGLLCRRPRGWPLGCVHVHARLTLAHAMCPRPLR